jgi:hypothetical protein
LTTTTNDKKTDETNIPGAAAWSQVAREQVARAEMLAGEIEKLEAAFWERMRAASRDAAELWADSMVYMATMSSGWRKLALDSARRASTISGVG